MPDDGAVDAARAVGRSHSTFVKRAKRDEQFAGRVELARQKARTDPLRSVYEASRTSWRAAAWLLEYLDRRAERNPPAEERETLTS